MWHICLFQLFKQHLLLLLGARRWAFHWYLGHFRSQPHYPKLTWACPITVFFIQLTSEIYSRRDQSPGMLGWKCAREFQNWKGQQPKRIKGPGEFWSPCSKKRKQNGVLFHFEGWGNGLGWQDPLGSDELSRVNFSYTKTNGGKDQHHMLVSYIDWRVTGLATLRR